MLSWTYKHSHVHVCIARAPHRLHIAGLPRTLAQLVGQIDAPRQTFFFRRITNYNHQTSHLKHRASTLERPQYGITIKISDMSLSCISYKKNAKSTKQDET